MRLRALCRARTASAALMLGLLVLVSGCAEPEPATELTAALDAARAAARDSTLGDKAIGQLEAFISKHPADAGVPAALMQLAILRQQQNSMTVAVAQYERILASFPTSGVADEAQFMIAFIREEHLDDLDGARLAYQAVIDNYPDSELAGQARTLLAHVGQSPDDYIIFQESTDDNGQ